jgi:uncharacterized protein YlxW (UPF0749 family)
MINNHIKVEGRPDLVRDPHSKAILNNNTEKLNYIKNIKELNNKYNKLQNEVIDIKNSINDIKQLLINVINKEESTNARTN